ncbi:MAG TPA: multidrug effflux MFS transporter [Alphaproteobacteria bacterium]|nr:multidrug effflux MFS transporter [Alphaproteobacteria bacterium]
MPHRATPVRAAVGSIVLLTSLVMVAQLSTSLYIPSLPSLSDALAADPAEVKMTMTAFLFTYALAQLLYGPVSDRFGRRPVLFTGLAIFLVGTVACGLATSLSALIVSRAIQGAGACAGPAIARAVVRDRYDRAEGARVLAFIGVAMALSPALGPIIGGKLQVWFDWRASFVALAVFGVCVAAVASLRLEESLKRPDPGATAPSRLARNYWSLVTHRTFRNYMAIVGSCFGAMFAFVTGLPFVLIEIVGLAPDVFGSVFVLIVVGYLSGSLTASRLAPRVHGEHMVAVGLALQTLASLLGLFAALTETLTIATVMGPIILFMFGFAIALPSALSGAMAPFPMMAGAASAMLGFAQMGVAALGSALVGVLYDGTAVPMAATMCLMGGIGALACANLWRAVDRSPG